MVVLVCLHTAVWFDEGLKAQIELTYDHVSWGYWLGSPDLCKLRSQLPVLLAAAASEPKDLPQNLQPTQHEPSIIFARFADSLTLSSLAGAKERHPITSGLLVHRFWQQDMHLLRGAVEASPLANPQHSV